MAKSTSTCLCLQTAHCESDCRDEEMVLLLIDLPTVRHKEQSG